jgi:hypothetical protein
MSAPVPDDRPRLAVDRHPGELLGIAKRFEDRTVDLSRETQLPDVNRAPFDRGTT